MKIPRFTAQMKEILVKGGQLTDEHIHLAQQLLKKQFPHLDGLQSTLLSETDGFEALQHEGIQIHHIRDLGHWVTSSSIGQSVAVYDSKFLGGQLSSSLTHQLALSYRLLVKTEDEDGEEMDPTLFIDVPYAQQQNGVSDCGLFAIAFAVHLALGDDAAGLNFDQSKMRQHLLKCFQRKTMMPFPQTKAGPHYQTYFPHMEIELFCTCQMPETYDDMVECDTCGDWYHLKCVGLQQFPAESEQWNCNKCFK